MNTTRPVFCTKQRSGALHLTQKVDYGITLLVHLSKNHGGQPVSIKKIAEESHLSFLFLQKIARSLQQAGLIEAGRGKFGGYKLTKTPQELSLKAIIEALEGSIAIVPCLRRSQENPCKHRPYCLVRPSFEKINEEIQNHLLSKNLSNFLTPQTPVTSAA